MAARHGRPDHDQRPAGSCGHPPACLEASAICYPYPLPTEALRRGRGTSKRQKPPDYRGFCLKRMKGFEPSTFAMARRRSSQLSYIRAVATF